MMFPLIVDDAMAQYEDHEEVVLWMNTVGPYHNRQETYAYFSLPFCVGTKQTISHYHETMSEALQGVELEFSGYEIDFKGEWRLDWFKWGASRFIHTYLHLFSQHHI